MHDNSPPPSLDSRPFPILLVALLGGALATGAELVFEAEKISVIEFLFDSIEKSLLFIGAGGVFFLLRQLKQDRLERITLRDQLEVARVEGGAWRKRVQVLVEGVGSEIEKQFNRWGLSEAEQEIARLLIKGLSHKEIGGLRGTSEATVRQQARTIYQKSGLPGKTAFAGYFLDGLLPPPDGSAPL